MTLRIGSLCSGYGGLDLGLMAVVGGSVAWHVEYDKHPSAVLDARFPGVPNYGDVTTTDWTQVEPVDWLTAGYPCQPFSHAGKRRGSKDERHLWPAVAHAIGVLRPGNVLLENVAGHLSLGLDAVLADLAALGYDARWGVVRAADAGAPHSRARVFIIATDTRHDEREVHAGDDIVDRERAAQRGWAVEPTRAGRDGADHLGALAGAHAAVGGATARDEAPAAITDNAGSGQGHAEPRGWAEPDDDLDAGEPARNTDCANGPTFGGVRTGTCAESSRIRGRTMATHWGAYAPAIRRWGAVTGRTAPRPTEHGRTGERLSPRFVEWMMGLPDGWVTDILPRNPALKALGNGVVPQQAALALSVLCHKVEVAA